MQVSRIVRCRGGEQEQERTHQTFRSRLTTYSRYFANFIESYAVLAEEAPVRDKIPLEAVRRQDRVLLHGRGARRADKGSKRH